MLNIVTPFSTVNQETAPFTLFGNRGVIHKGSEIVRRSRGDDWIYCPTSALSNPKDFMAETHYTELFFLDEATALAAGHRPCGYCNKVRFKEFIDAWSTSHDGEKALVDEIDNELKAHRSDDAGQLTYEAEIDSLPAGVMIQETGGTVPLLLFRYSNPKGEEKRCAYPWTSHGYGIKRELPTGNVMVLTPRPIVDVILAGFEPGPAQPLLAW